MFDHAFNYVESDLPAALTLAQYRRTRLAATPRRRLGWLRTYVPVRRPRPVTV